MGNWEVKIYKNDEVYTKAMVKNGVELNTIRTNYKISEDYYFISKDNIIIYDENNFTVKDIYKNDPDGGYKIDIMTFDYFQSSKNGLITLYRNNFKHSSIKYEKDLTLRQIYNKMNNIDDNCIPVINNYSDNEELYFLSPNKTIIIDSSNITAKDVITFDQTKKERGIYLVTRRFYQKLEIIDCLNDLESMERIEWLSQEEFFKKLVEFCGNGVVQAIQDELYNDIKNENKVNDKDFIKKFKRLLIEDNNIDKSTKFSDL